MLLVALVSLLLPRSTAHALSTEDRARLLAAAVALDELRIEEAEPMLAELATRHPDDPDVRFERGLLRYLRGDYAGADADMVASLLRATGVRDAEARGELARIVHATRGATSAFEESRSADGRYVVRYAPGPDRVLAPYALEAMEAIDRALEAELGTHHPGPIRLEIYPTTATLADVSSLTVEEIERTGTIALCKWDRLMITSPRALVRGYPWVDTMGHEAVHLMVSRGSHDRAPVWMQEGIARFLEQRWRGGAAVAQIDPASEVLLQEAARTDELLPFDRLHPSIAMLPTAEAAALAFAQVATFVEGFYASFGAEGLREVIGRVAMGADARVAFADVAGAPWERLEGSWRDSIASRPRPPDDAPGVRRLRFMHGETVPDELDEVEEENARRHVRLGDLLWSHQRPRAASVEYEAAHAIAPRDAVVASRLARTAVEGGRAAQAILTLEPLRALHGDHEPLLATLAAAYAAEGRLADARSTALEAIRVNPFDPQPHCVLAEVTDQDAIRARERASCAALSAE